MSEAASYRRDALIIGLALAVILGAIFAPFLFGDRSLMSSAAETPSLYVSGATTAPPISLRALDAGAPSWQVEPAFALSHHIMFDEHRLPFWDPNGGYGKPFMGAMVPQQFYPLSTLEALAPSPRAYAWWIVARLFIAGLFTGLFVRLFIRDRWAALGAAVAGALAGYYLVYYDMPHLSVETALPMVLWATELNVRRVTSARVGALAAAVGLVVLGGMPESMLLALAAGVLYGLTRVLQFGPGHRRGSALAIAGAYAVGLALGAIELVPFLELLKLGASTHDPSTLRGLGYDGSWQGSLLTELLPRAFGNPWQSIFGPTGLAGSRGFFGLAVLVLAATAVVTALRRRGPYDGVIAFFAVLALFIVLKRFGNPLVNWTGYLPFFVQIDFPKDAEAVLAVCMSILAGFGLGIVRERASDRRFLVAGFALALAALTYLFLFTRGFVAGNPLAPGMYDKAFVVALVALLAAGICGYVVASERHPQLRRAATAGLILLLAAEPFANYLWPVVFKSAPPITDNAYAGAPFTTYLQQHMADGEQRMLGISGSLFPNWASAFGILDVRSLEAVRLHDYLPFVDAFIASAPVTADDQADRFTATRPITLDAPLVQRWLALSSVGFIVAPQRIYVGGRASGSVLDPLWAQVSKKISAEETAAVRPAFAELDGVPESVFFEHPPHDLTYRVVVPPDRTRFIADIALDPQTYAGPICGGAVTYTLRAFTGQRQIAQTVRTIDPKHNLAQRHWIPFWIDLAAARGRPVDLHLQTSAVNTCAAWSVWGEPRFTLPSNRGPARPPKALYPLVFQSPGAYVFQVDGSLPRLALFHRAVAVPSFGDALKNLTASSFDVHHEVTVEGPVPPLGSAQGRETVRITASRSDELQATVDAAAPGLVMQTDSWYPGWRATVDGNDTPILRVDGIFRGIPVAAGHHVLVISYDSKVALVGFIISLLGLVALIALFAVSRKSVATNTAE